MLRRLSAQLIYGVALFGAAAIGVVHGVRSERATRVARSEHAHATRVSAAPEQGGLRPTVDVELELHDGAGGSGLRAIVRSRNNTAARMRLNHSLQLLDHEGRALLHALVGQVSEADASRLTPDQDFSLDLGRVPDGYYELAATALGVDANGAERSGDAHAYVHVTRGRAAAVEFSEWYYGSGASKLVELSATAAAQGAAP